MKIIILSKVQLKPERNNPPLLWRDSEWAYYEASHVGPEICLVPNTNMVVIGVLRSTKT